MTEQAIILGQLGKAIYKENGVVWETSASDPSKVWRCNRFDLDQLLSSFAEIYMAKPLEDVDVVRQKLTRLTASHRALSLILCSLDLDLTWDTKTECLQTGEELLQDSAVYEFVKWRMTSRVFPSGIDSDSLEKVCTSSEYRFAREILSEACALQPELQRVWKIFHSEALESFEDRDHISYLQDLFIELGIFSLLARAAKGKSDELASDLASVFAQNPALNNAQHVMFMNRLSHRVAKPIRRIVADEAHDVSRNSRRMYRDVAEFLNEAYEGFAQIEESGISNYEAKDRIDRQIDAIKKEIHLGNIGLAERYLMDLIKFNVESSQKEHVGMTLCSLAASAIDANELEYANKLVSDALQLKIEDPVIYCMEAEVYRNAGDLERALQLYSSAKERFPERHYPSCGYAEVLRELGRYDDAESAYLQAKRDFPDVAVPSAGYAEVFRSRGDFASAEKLYKETIEGFPEEYIPRCGYVEVLKARGNYSRAIREAKQVYLAFGSEYRVASTYAEALKAAGQHNEAMEVYLWWTTKTNIGPNPHVKYAELLSEVGRVAESRNIYETTLQEFPTSMMALIGYSHLLIKLHSYEEVVNRLSGLRIRSVLDWRGLRTLAFAYERLGDSTKAAELLQFGLESIHWEWLKPLFRASLGYVRLRQNRYSEALELMRRDLPVLDHARRARRLLLIARLESLAGNLDRAQTTLNLVSEWPILKFKDAIARAMGQNTLPDSLTVEVDEAELELAWAA